MKTIYTFDLNVEITHELEFRHIPIKELCDAARKRLETIEANDERGSFNLFDEIEESV